MPFGRPVSIRKRLAGSMPIWSRGGQDLRDGNHHREKIRKKFKKALGTTPVVTLGIPDEYEFMQPELVALFKERLPRYAD
ncbi:hypothetical protein AAFN47_26240 [Hoeflea sp. CAU 1731]